MSAQTPFVAAEPAAGKGARTAGARAMARLDALSRCSGEPDALTRLYLTPEHRAAADLVAGWMAEAGMSVHLDAAATVLGRYPAERADAPVLIFGSHIDTVRNAGRYDGNLGVVVAIEAIAALHAQGVRLPFAVDVVAFGDEEGVRFPVTLTGSRALAGTFDPASLAAVDADGTTLRAALAAFGCDADAIARLGRDPLATLAYLEVHIEQGPVLESEDLAVGVVTAINGASRLTVEVAGKAGHAGTVPMALRHDAGMAAAEMMLAVEAAVRGTPDLVATVGVCTFLPGAVNVIPAGARFTVDVRSADDAARAATVAALCQRFEAIAGARRVSVSWSTSYEAPAAACDPRVIALLADAVRDEGQPARLLPSGAGHDGLAMIALCPIGMLFVRCLGGISHNPAESVRMEDVAVAVDVTVRLLRSLPAALPPRQAPSP